MKRVAARRKQQHAISDEQVDVDADESTDTALYAIHQTIEYQSPPVLNGRIPKNIYGNLDIYVPSMVPAGGAHVVHPECARAARLLGVDCADAVTGFAFKGRHGTAIINGAVVATEHVTAIEEVIYGLAYEHAQQEEAHRSSEALKMWRRLLAGLRIRERIEGYRVEGEDELPQDSQVGSEDEPLDHEAGGFFPTGDVDAVVDPIAPRQASQELDYNTGGGFMADDDAISKPTSHGLHEFESNINSQKAFSEKTSFEHPGLNTQEAMRETEWPTFSIKVIYGRDDHPRKGNQARDFMLQDDREVPRMSPLRDVSQNAMPFGLADDDLAQATMLQQAYEGQNPIGRTTERDVAASRSKTPARLQTGLKAPDELTVPPVVINPKEVIAEDIPLDIQEDVPARNRDSDSDECSLLSADPEDEDADPEWLV